MPKSTSLKANYCGFRKTDVIAGTLRVRPDSGDVVGEIL
jgi:hypothetical protein